MGLRMDWGNCLEVRSFTGWLERIYRKSPAVLRSEVKCFNVSVESIYTFLKGNS